MSLFGEIIKRHNLDGLDRLISVVFCVVLIYRTPMERICDSLVKRQKQQSHLASL